jgi:putative FmdB family regulatory protein
MPTYEYKCEACGFEFEKFQSIKSSPTRKCPNCGKNRVKRLISSGAGLIFKGGGFYITDYRSEAYKSDAKADKGDSAPAKESTTSDSSKKTGDSSKTAASSEGDSASKKPAADSKPAPAAKPAADSKSAASSSAAKSAKSAK